MTLEMTKLNVVDGMPDQHMVQRTDQPTNQHSRFESRVHATKKRRSNKISRSQYCCERLGRGSQPLASPQLHPDLPSHTLTHINTQCNNCSIIFNSSMTDRRTDQRKDQRTDGQSLLWSCMCATKKGKTKGKYSKNKRKRAANSSF